MTLTLMFSMDVVVQPSVPWMGLNDEIKDSGLFFPVDPGPSVRFDVLHDLAIHPRNPNAEFRTCSDGHGRLELEAWWVQAAGKVSGYQ
jgi:FAD/FMN-containing dehydrogenase